MRRLARVVLVSSVAVAMMSGHAAGRSLSIWSDPNDTPGQLDIRRVWTDLSGAVFVKIGNWTRLRLDDVFAVRLDTRGSFTFDRVIQIGLRDCNVWDTDERGFLDRFIDGRKPRRPSKRTIACQLPAGWFAINKTVRFVVVTGESGGRQADRAPDTRRFVGL